MNKKQSLDIDKLCEMAHISLTEKEKEKFKGEIDDILQFVGSIEEYSSDSGIQSSGARLSELRPDEADTVFTQDELLSSAPKKDRGMPYVKRIVEGG